MAERIVIDSGPLVALLSRTDLHHAWAMEQVGRFAPPLFTCEAVLSETQFLVRQRGGNPLTVLEMVQRGMLNLAFKIEDETERLLELQRAYSDVPMSLADACLVRMTELHEPSLILTTDSDFHIYRRNKRQVIRLRVPPNL